MMRAPWGLYELPVPAFSLPPEHQANSLSKTMRLIFRDAWEHVPIKRSPKIPKYPAQVDARLTNGMRLHQIHGPAQWGAHLLALQP